ncbi:hypothetical protein [Paracoccus zhejiangensis]|uniref:Uncharacterized protein n=1 Tax=Paracoccus zhejiangensis TaxID=1077935 RepID=A0A2H5F142_9RHOB|nr:hypothetical protein [Paracoccus zhejiangensis]AUH65253.1 hypothetical protein CX676_14675 [Paracoccus zhejiangensis]
MLKLSGQNGDGIGALGLKPHADGTYEIAVVDTVMSDEEQALRKAGLGGARYLRHCLEAIVLERGGLWPPEVLDTSLDLLELIDGGRISTERYEVWSYGETAGDLTRQEIRAFTSSSASPLQKHEFPEKHIDFDALLSRMAGRYEDELGRASLRHLWIDRYRSTLKEYVLHKAGPGPLLAALLTRQALAERNFVINSARTGQFDAGNYLELVSLRYVRTLCQFELSKGSMLRRPDLIEVGRTILLLAAVGLLQEARELGTRAVSGEIEKPFLPALSRLALAWASGRLDLMIDLGRPDFKPHTDELARGFLDSLSAKDVEGCAAAVAGILAARNHQLASFSDDYVTDFDDDLSWSVPYDAGALLRIAAAHGLVIGRGAIDHGALDLPTATFPDLQSDQLRYLDLYGLLVKRSAEGL